LLPLLGMLAACGTDSTPTEPTGPKGAAAASAFVPPVLLQRLQPAQAQPGSSPLASGCSGGCPADSVLLDFEGLGGAGDVLLLQDQYQALGIHFANAIVAVIPAFNSDEYPPRSGVASATADPFLSGDGSGTLFLRLDKDAVRVRGYVTSFSPLTLRCFNAQGAQLADAVFPGGNLAVHHGGPANQPVEVSGTGIRSCQFLGPDNHYAIDDLTVVWAEGVDLTLSCPSTVVRADPAVCTASAPRAFTLQVVGWSFRPTEIDTVLQREGVAPTDTTWSGLMVASGLVRVHALVNGALDSASAAIVVTPRDWSKLEVRFLVEDYSLINPLPERPTRLGQLGNFEPFADAYFPTGHPDLVTEGLNAGFYFFTEVPVEALARIRINRVALDANSAFYLRQRPNSAGGAPGMCRRQDVVPFRPLVEAHEGLGLELLSHAGVYKSELNRLVPHATEGVVGLEAGEPLRQSALAAARSAIESAQLSARDQHNGGLVPPVPYHCSFRYFN
jgi:hypothetical protein